MITSYLHLLGMLYIDCLSHLWPPNLTATTVSSFFSLDVFSSLLETILTPSVPSAYGNQEDPHWQNPLTIATSLYLYPTYTRCFLERNGS